MNPLKDLEQFGQAPWLDNLSRGLVQSGELKRLADEEGIKGLTSNPAIFEKSIGHSDEYDEEIAALLKAGTTDIAAIFRRLAVADIQAAAEALTPVYKKTKGVDGYVSLEVSPYIAHDEAATVAEAREIWADVGRPNLMVKVPATAEGIPAFQTLISEGINVNVTLLFAKDVYVKVAEAYIAGLEDRAVQGQPVDRVASVASFFLSRIDVLLDPRLEKLAASGGPQAPGARELIGQVAIASAKAAYTIYQVIFGSARFKKLAANGARPQRLLWASTSTKNPAYPDLKYVEPLIGADTVNTLPPETLAAYRDHGDPAARLTEGVDRAAGFMQRLPEMGIDLDRATQQLEDEGVEKFNQPFDSLMATLEGKRREVLAGRTS